MPAVQHEIERFKTTVTSRFLSNCQRQSSQANQPKVASLSFQVTPIASWAVLDTLGQLNKRHFYYDPPQKPSLVGLGVVVGTSAAGPNRFEQAQIFVQQWRSHFIYTDIYPDLHSDTIAPAAPHPCGHFFCSATFFDSVTTAPVPDSFEPVYIFVPQVQVATHTAASTITFNCLVTETTDIDHLSTKIHRQLRQLIEAPTMSGAKKASRKVVTKEVSGFVNTVQSALASVSCGNVHKVVLADVMEVVAPQSVDVVRSLQTLRQNHPDCTVFSVGNGRGQSFIGASPERLLSVSAGQLKTDALAGSASRSKLSGIDRQLAQSLLNSHKERYEHRVVVEFIVQQLRSLDLSPHYESDPQILRLLHIQHLHTPITAELRSQSVSPLEILARLHPTPAVAGLPRSLACQLIHQHETFDRGLYAAPLGWIDTAGNSEFIVGIRSALIDGCKARLYAGAGIVRGSEPAKELAEIKLKLQTLLNALV